MFRFLPFEMVDSSEFKAFVGQLDKTINMKTAVTYSRQMEQYSAEVLEQVKVAISKYCTAVHCFPHNGPLYQQNLGR